MWEIMSREQPYPELDTRWDVERAVKLGQRPPIDPMCPSGYVDVMKRCWADQAGDRPAFGSVVTALEALHDALLRETDMETAA